MHSIELLEEALEIAKKAGFEIRTEFLGESTGGACRIGNQWVLYLDLRLPAGEQLERVVEALKASGVVHPETAASRPMRALLLQNC